MVTRVGLDMSVSAVKRNQQQRTEHLDLAMTVLGGSVENSGNPGNSTGLIENFSPLNYLLVQSGRHPTGLFLFLNHTTVERKEVKVEK